MKLDDYAANVLTQTPTIGETVVQALRQAILDGTLEGGAPIRQEEVARTFGVSRVPIREALLRLEGEGLVETVPRRGVIVTMLTSEQFTEILEMRLALETLALRIAAPRFTEADVQAAAAVLAESREGMQAATEPDLNKEIESRWGELNWKFHRCLYAPANRPRLLTHIENLQQLFARHLRARMADSAQTQADPEAAQEDSKVHLQEWAGVLDEHEQMLQACANHDAKTAAAILEHHISDHGTEVVRRLKNKK